MRRSSVGRGADRRRGGDGLTPSIAGADAIVIGQGRLPALAVDASGTAYVSWWEAEVDSSCSSVAFRGRDRVRPGAASSIPVHGDGLTPAPVVVSGSRVVAVAARYVNEASGTGPMACLPTRRPTAACRSARATSSDRCRSSTACPAPVTPSREWRRTASRCGSRTCRSTARPRRTRTGPRPSRMRPSRPTSSATTRPSDCSMPSTPLVVYQHGAGGTDAAFRRYDGSGSVNDAANWTPQVSIGPLYGPQARGRAGRAVPARQGLPDLLERECRRA